MKPKILFVDDEQNILDSYRRMLRRIQPECDLEFTTNAKVALELIAAERPHVIVSDIDMPVMDGLTFLAEVQSDESTRDIPFIIVTGKHESGLKRTAIELGAVDLLSKPVDCDEMVARLRSAVRLKVYQDRLASSNQELEAAVVKRTLELEESRLDIVFKLGMVAEARDEDTGQHVIRVGYYCRAIAESMGMGSEFVERITLASPLHDIGKVAIPDGVLLKPGPLTPDERLVMQTHCEIGRRILCHEGHRYNGTRDIPVGEAGKADVTVDLLHFAGSIAFGHHERWDGSGYPRAISGESIPIEARITAVADVFDALSSERPYKPAFSEDRCLEELRAGAGSQFDAEAVRAFERSIDTVRNVRAEFNCGNLDNGNPLQSFGKAA